MADPYAYGTDTSAGCYLTNYLVALGCLCGFVWNVASRPPPQPIPQDLKEGLQRASQLPLLGAAVGLQPVFSCAQLFFAAYGVSYLLSGIMHMSVYHVKCPYPRDLGNGTHVDVACPEGVTATGYAVIQRLAIGAQAVALACLLVLGVALGPLTLARSCFRGAVVAAAVLGAALLAFALAYDPTEALHFTLVGVFSLLATLIAVGLGLAAECCSTSGFSGASRLFLLGACLSLAGQLAQIALGGACGGYGSAVDCPLPWDGRDGFNHNALYHLLEFAAKALWVLASRKVLAGRVLANDRDAIVEQM